MSHPQPAGRQVVLGLDFGGSKIATAVCDMSGVRLAGAIVDSLPELGAAAAMARGLDAAKGLLTELGPHVLRAVGATTFGIPMDDGVRLAPAIPGWETLAFGRALREAFPAVPVRMGTDVKAAAAAELRWGALAGRDPALYLNLGTGLAVAVVADGKVVAGAHQAAGEIGYMARTVRDTVEARTSHAPLEAAVSGKALGERASRQFGRLVTAADVFALADDDARASTLVDEFVQELAAHIANLAVAIDPECIVVGGGMVRSWERISPGLKHALDIVVPFPPELLTAAYPYDAPLMGALALGVEATVRRNARAHNNEKDPINGG